MLTYRQYGEKWSKIMKLHEDKNWRAVHFEDRTILKSDRALFGKLDWDRLLNLNVKPMKTKGHYKVIEE